MLTADQPGERRDAGGRDASGRRRRPSLPPQRPRTAAAATPPAPAAPRPAASATRPRPLRPPAADTSCRSPRCASATRPRRLADRLVRRGYKAFVLGPADRVRRRSTASASDRSRSRPRPSATVKRLAQRRAVQALDLALAVLSGALLALAFPKFGHPAVAWVALVPWLLAVRVVSSGRRTARRPRVPARAGAGAAYFAGTLYWIPDVLVTFGGLSRLVAIPVAGLLIAYLALYPGDRLVAGRPRRRPCTASAASGWRPFAWVGDGVAARAGSSPGFRGCRSATARCAGCPMAQAASLAGVWGLSALVAAVNAAMRGCCSDRPRGACVPPRGDDRAASRRSPPGAPGGLGDDRRHGAVAAGRDRPGQRAAGPEVVAGVRRRDPAALPPPVARGRARRGARLIVWPESATPFFFEEDPVGAEAIRAAGTGDRRVAAVRQRPARARSRPLATTTPRSS